MIISKEKIFFILIIIFFVIYLLFQSRHFFYNSNIEYNYHNNSFVKKEEIFFKGTASHLKNLTINKEKIFLDLDGNFSKTIYLYNGKNVIYLEYENIFNKKKKKKIILYRG